MKTIHAMLLGAAAALASPAAAQEAKPTANFAAPAKTFGRVSYDARSLMIDGKRMIIWSSEMHAFRLPSPDLWRDILQKMKASGFNTVAFYFDWGFHSPKKGVYDFSGIRDIDRLLTMAEEEGLYVITRAGPYVNAELTRGGFPGWLVNQRARARTDDPEYLAAADEWLTKVNAIIARHQINGDGKGHKGTVILHQIENELALTTPVQRRYMDHLYAKARADGINVPIFHNDQGRNGYWVPGDSKVDKTIPGPNDLYAFDGYPGGTCTVEGKPTRGSAAPDWGYYGPGGAKGGASASPNTPGFLAEFGGGWFDYWGSNGGYECNAIQRGKRFQRVFYGTNLVNGIFIQSFYMGFGGTSWGWLPAPVVFTSYDYGAAISETREIRSKAEELKQLAGLIASVPHLAGMVPAGPVRVSSDKVQVYHNKSPETDARFLLVTHKPSNARTDDRFTVTADLPDGRYTLPLQLDGYDAKWLVAGVNLGGQRLVYSTSELQAALRQDGRDVVLVYGRTGEAGETVLRYANGPRVTVLEGRATSSFDAARGDLKLSYGHRGLSRIRISGGGRPDLLLLIGDEAEGTKFWRQGEALVRGPALVRGATAKDATLALTGDTREASPLEVWAPANLHTLSWNGVKVAATRSASGSLVANIALPGPAEFALPSLTGWRMAAGTPEAEPKFDDSNWQKIDNRAYASITTRPDGQPNLLMDAYGFHEGDVWYRGRFTGGARAERLRIHYGAGGSGIAQVFLDGVLIGQNELPDGLPRPITAGAFSIELPEEARAPGEHVLSAMVRNNGHNWDLDADDFHKEARGLVSASIEPVAGPSFAVPIAWRIQGRAGGEDLADPVRGVANNGGQYGERMGWHLPGFDDRSWKPADVPAIETRAGTTWYRTSFDLAVPKGQDATIGIALGDTSKPRSASAAYRVLIFVNGWNMGQFIAHVGPQRIFPVPEGILNHRGRNTIALAVTSDGVAGDALEEVKLVTLRDVKGGLPVRMVPAPATPGELK
ncbi:beta-galactosidase [Sphingomonas sp. JC676]|uniref:glycoside hydrolase family 35 protein n=1 Tax=Sphingomonas sp. JC676 TaxID=2768065 RepID=UPI001657F7F0|nr:beta-galactosidase [Sphingomonas sp. JC676]MBC9032408.1 beta-galactosidase [Sphingomonas sp. JC676]